jgi:outer membrane protein assembly factor BamA
VKVSATLGQYVRGGKLSFAQPYFLDNRMTLASTYSATRS